MYDDDFANRYGGMVELLIKDIANISRTDTNFPYMRNFDVNEGHSWADGMGGSEISSNSDSIDEESSSEAMNAWSAIYLWGMATNRTSYPNYANSDKNIKLGIWLYTNHYNSLRDYYFDVDSGDSQKEIYPLALLPTYGNHGSIGVLFGGRGWYYVHWNPSPERPIINAREIKGIQILPVTPAMMYLGYDKDYAQNNFYAKMLSEASGDYYWNDVWEKYHSLFDPASAWTDFTTTPTVDDGGTRSFTYHFINYFKQYGTPVTTYSADFPSYLVTEDSGKKTFMVYNFLPVNKIVRFYSSDGSYAGSLNVNAKSSVSSDSLINDESKDNILVYPVPYKPGSGGSYDAKGIMFDNIGTNAKIRIFNVAGEMVFLDTIQNTFYIWDAKNKYGNNVASGVYIYYITSNEGKTFKGKIAVER
jgi:hypothetical protein